MRRLTLEFAAAIALTLAAIITTAAGAMANDIMVTGAFARASASPAVKVGGVYLSLMNHGAADRLVAIASPAAKSAELHRMVMDGDVMKMEPVGPLDLPAGAMLDMAPGGMHVMLMDLVRPLKQGDTVELTLTFEKAGAVTVTVPVASPGAMGP